jgi:hypothetical protein
LRKIKFKFKFKFKFSRHWSLGINSHNGDLECLLSGATTTALDSGPDPAAPQPLILNVLAAFLFIPGYTTVGSAPGWAVIGTGAYHHGPQRLITNCPAT